MKTLWSKRVCAAVLSLCSCAPQALETESEQAFVEPVDDVADDVAHDVGAALEGLGAAAVATASHESMPLPGQPHIKLAAMAANGHALSWDGRLAFLTTSVAGELPRGLAPAFSFAAGGLTLLMGQSLSAGDVRLVLNTQGNLVLLRQGVPVWSTNTAGACTVECRAQFQADGNLVLRRPIGGSFQAYWVSGTRGTALTFYGETPFAGIVDAAGATVWMGVKANVTGWALKVFRPETLSSAPAVGRDAVASALNASFSAPFPWAVPPSADARFFPRSTRPSLEMMNALSVMPDSAFAENPHRSDALGNDVATGAFLTYHLVVATQRYAAESGTTSQIGVLKGVVVVASPFTETAEVRSATLTQDFTLLDAAGPLVGIEPTVTFDGKLLVYQRFGTTESGTLYFTVQSGLSGSTTGWSAPRPLTEMYDDLSLRRRYALARYPIRDVTGARLTGLKGAYPWVSLDGTDVFFAATLHEDGARRAGTSVVGASSRGLVRLLDGGPNVSRRGTFPRLFVSSLGRSPGRWSPLEFMPHKVLPLTDKLATYPLFTSNAQRYFEASFEETVADTYDVYFEMSEAIANGDYALDAVPDVSGHFHAARRQGGALFAEEAFSAQCDAGSCPLNDPWSPSSNLYSGKAMYFQRDGLLVAPAASNSGHVLLRGARDLTVSLAVLPLVDPAVAPSAGAAVQTLVRKAGTFRLSLGRDGRTQATLEVRGVGGVQTLSTGAWGPVLPVGTWTHVAVTYEAAPSRARLFIDGSPVAEQLLGAPGAALQVIDDATGSLTMGPGGANLGNATSVLALDQVAVSGLRRTTAELLRQANKVFPRAVASPRQLPLGLKRKDVGDLRFIATSAAPAKVELGRHLFFDPRLSASNSTSCATCHGPLREFTEAVALHPSRLANFGGAPRLLRNTPSLVNLAFYEAFFADGRAASLEVQAHHVLRTAEEMGRDVAPVLRKLESSAQLRALFAAAYPGVARPITTANLTAALAEFQRSLLSGGSRFDRYNAGDLTALTAQERLGKNLFFGKAGCAECHAGSALTDNAFHALPFIAPTNGDGVLDEGRARVTVAAAERFRVRTPSLRGVGRTAPFFHQGAVATLAEVIALYDQAVDARAVAVPLDDALFELRLTSGERTALEAFLGALQGQTPAVQAPVLADAPPPLTASRAFDPGGFRLTRGQSFALAGLTLELTNDGNFLAYSPTGQPVFSTDTQGDCVTATCQVVFQSDGNLVVYRGAAAVWSSRTFAGRTQGARFIAGEQRPYLRVTTANGSLAWASSYEFDAGFQLVEGQFVRWWQGSAQLFLEQRDDGVLQLTRGATTAWTSGPPQAGTGNCRAVMQSDGNFVVYRGPQWLWSSQTHAEPRKGKTLLLAPTGPAVQVLSASRVLVWASP